MDATLIPQPKEFEPLINDLRVLMDVAAITVHETNTAGKTGNILTIVMEGNFHEIASEMYDRADKLFVKHSVQLPYKIIDCADVIHKLKDGNIYYLKWYLTGTSLFKNDKAYLKIFEKTLPAQTLFRKATKYNTQMFGKADSLFKGARHYLGTNSHQLALLTIHQNIILLFGIIGELTSGKAYSGNNLNDQQGINEELAPAVCKLFDATNNVDAELVRLLHTVTRSFPYNGKMKIKKETVTNAFKKMHWMLKEAKKIYAQQLFSCEAGLAVFKETVREKFSKLPEIEDENFALEKISGIINHFVKTNAIYCFGKNKMKSLTDCAADEEKIGNTHFYLLVFEDGLTVNASHDLALKIRSKSKGRYTATLLIHNIAELETQQPDQKYFFYKVLNDGQQLSLNPESQSDFRNLQPLQRDLESAKEYLQYRNNIVNILLEYVADGYDLFYSPLIGVLFHQVIEQACLAMIRLFLGYTSNYFSIAYLLEICQHFSPEIANYFPRRTEQDLRLLKLLSTTTQALRYSGKDTISDEDMHLLEIRCNDFVDHADAIVKTFLNDTSSGNTTLKNESL